MTSKVVGLIKNERPELVIAHNTLAEYFTFTSGIDAMPWLPEYEIKKSKLWRIATDVRWATMRAFLSDEDERLVHRIGVNYFLMPEFVWQTFLNELNSEKEIELLKQINTWRNPHKIRPGFLLKKR